MGLIAQCDGGCGATTDDIQKFKEFGIAKKVWYCSECAEQMDNLYKARDSLHTDYATILKNALLFEISVFMDTLPKARLPDAPE